MFSYKAIVRNIQLMNISPDLNKLKKFIEDQGIGGIEKAPTKRSYSFEDISAILSNRSYYAI